MAVWTSDIVICSIMKLASLYVLVALVYYHNTEKRLSKKMHATVNTKEVLCAFQIQMHDYCNCDNNHLAGYDQDKDFRF